MCCTGDGPAAAFPAPGDGKGGGDVIQSTKTFISACSTLSDAAGAASKAPSYFNTGIPLWGAKAPRKPLRC